MNLYYRNIITISQLLLAFGWCLSAAQSEINWIGGTVYDFGEIKESDGIVMHKFLFRNISNKPFMVLGAMERCGCTTATYPQKEIAPGDTSCINVNFDPVNRNGGFKQRVTILLSGPSRCNTYSMLIS